MRTHWLCPLAAWVALASVPSAVADLAKVDRRIAKEPTYQTKQAQYCLLVFGPDAQTRVWLVLDGDTLYVDRNGNGDLTEAGEAVKAKDGKFDTGPITAKDGVAPGTRVELKRGALTYVYCHSAGKSWQRAVVDKTGNLDFAPTRQDAPIIHFNGPLTLAPRFDEPFDRNNATEIDIMVGTPGLGIGTFSRLANDAVTPDVHPIAELVFPTADGQSEKMRVVLTQRC